MKSRHDLDKINPFGLDAVPNPFRRNAKLKGDDYEYMRSVSEALLAQSTPASSAILYLIIVLTVIALTWASVSKVDAFGAILLLVLGGIGVSDDSITPEY